MASGIMAATALSSLGYSVYSGERAHEEQKDAAKEQKKALEQAEAKQKEADLDAEQKRLEALAANQGATDFSNIWGIDSELSKQFAGIDTTKKKDGMEMSFDEEDNPFYTRGLF